MHCCYAHVLNLVYLHACVQVSSMKAKSKTGRRWHPLFIRWCLNIAALASSKAYSMMQDSGFITLPSKRTLRDYTHWFKSKPGFQLEVDKYLREEAKVDELDEWKRCSVMLRIKKFECPCILLIFFRNVVVIFDEMKIHEDLVFGRDGDVVGFTDTGDINNKIRLLEQYCKGIQQEEIATHVLCLMVRGIFIRMQFPYAQFPTTGVMIQSCMRVQYR